MKESEYDIIMDRLSKEGQTLFEVYKQQVEICKTLTTLRCNDISSEIQKKYNIDFSDIVLIEYDDGKTLTGFYNGVCNEFGDKHDFRISLRKINSKGLPSKAVFPYIKLPKINEIRKITKMNL